MTDNLTDKELRAVLDASLPHTAGCVAHRSAGPSGCLCFHERAVERLLAIVRAYGDQRAAEALREVALELSWPDPRGMWRASDVIRARADARALGTADERCCACDQPHRWQQEDGYEPDARPLCRQCRRERAEGDHTREQR